MHKKIYPGQSTLYNPLKPTNQTHRAHKSQSKSEGLSVSAREYSITPMCSVATVFLFPRRGSDHPVPSATYSTLQNDATISYTQNPKSLRLPVSAGGSDFQWLPCVQGLFLCWEFLGGGVGDFDVGEFFLADGADGVGVCIYGRCYG
jgi:hypothetical protein